MRILILHSLPDSFVRYGEYVDHDKHDIIYVSTAERISSLPQSVKRSVVIRDESCDRQTSILIATKNISPPPNLVISLSEFDVITAAKVRSMFGLPGLTVEQVTPFRDKVAMKTLIRGAGLHAPRFLPVPEALDRISAPSWAGKTVLKPIAGASSKDTHTYTTPRAALEAVRSGSFAGQPSQFEIEEFIEGPILHIDGVLIGGATAVIQASRYVGNCLSYAVDGAPLGGVHIDTPPEIVNWSHDCLRAVGLIDGLFHLEAIVTPDGPAFLEVAARCGAVGVVESFERATGLHLPGVGLKLMIEGPEGFPAPRTPRHDERYGWFVFPGHHLGTAMCRVMGADAVRTHPLVARWEQHATDQQVKKAPSYSYQHVPVGGVIGPGTTAELVWFLNTIYDAITIQPFPAPKQVSPFAVLP